MKTYVSIKTKDQLKAARALRSEYEILVPLCLAGEISDVDEVWIVLPDVLRENRREIYEAQAQNTRAAKGVVIQNIDEIGFLKSIDYEGDVIAGEQLYSYNSEAASFYRGLFPEMKFIAPAELTDDERAVLEKASELSFIYKVYGCQKLMTTAQYLNGAFADNNGNKFTAVYDEKNNYSEIYTAHPVSMLDRKEAWKEKDILFEFANEDAKEMSLVLETMSAADYIRGHHFKGVD